MLGFLIGAGVTLAFRFGAPKAYQSTAKNVEVRTQQLFGPFITYGPPMQNTIEASAYGKAKALLIAREGDKKNNAGQHITYYDSRMKLTGGIGHLIKPGDGYTREGQVIPQAQVDAWFAKDMSDAFVKAKAQALEIKKYTPDMIAVLTSANFQLGDFKSVFYNSFNLLKTGSITRFVNNIMQSAWASQTPTRVADLVSTVKQEYGVA